MNKLEVGMHCRTKNGYIAKICNINDFREPSMKYGIEANYLNDIYFIGDKDIKIASFNIIDLIEVGDYVNGHTVKMIKEDKSKIDIGEGEDYFWLRNQDIKSIVIKEMFKQMKYEVE